MQGSFKKVILGAILFVITMIFAIFGFGHIGQVLAKQLNEGKEFFVIIDNDVENLTTAKNRSYLVQEGDATDENVLLEVGIQKAKVLATVLPNDATNVFITLTARELNPDLIILARGELPSTEKN
jgi:voltage-gated potassium channel